MNAKHLGRNFLTISAGILLLAAQANADHREKRADVDIDSLKAEIYPERHGWRVGVRYEVEVEDYYGKKPLLLVMNLRERGRVLTERDGRPIEIVVPLDRPTEIDDDELEFEDSISVSLDEHVVCYPGSLRIEATVVDPHTNRPLERKQRSVRYRRRGCDPYDGGFRFGLGLRLFKW